MSCVQGMQQTGQPGDFYQQQQAQQPAGGWGGPVDMQAQQGGAASQLQWGAGWQGASAPVPAGPVAGSAAGPASPQYFGSAGFPQQQPAQQGGAGLPWQGMDAQPGTMPGKVTSVQGPL